MFPYIGIMADEEPKDSISPSGLYNSSESTATKNDFSTPLIDGLSEFTFMMWVYVPTAITYVAPYIEKGAYIGNSMPFIIKNGSIGSSITNSNGGRTVVDYFTAVPKDEFIHVTVTGSVSNNRIRMYLNGSLGQSAVMTYANDVSTSSFLSLNQTGFSISHVNAFNRELSEAEVAEHYVYDDDLLFAGVLGYDAMTASQRNGLVYSSSYTKDISIAGNEFTDKSGNGVTLSPQPTLTGEQIYVYTDADDLPNGGGVPVIHPVNSFYPDGGTQSARKTGYSMTGKFTNFSWSCWVKLQDTGNGQTVFRVSSSVGGVSDIALMYDWSALDPSLADKITIGWHSGTTTWEYISTSNFTVGQWIHIVVGKSGANWKLYINKILELDYTATTTPTELSNCILATEHNSLVEKLASPCSQYYMANQQLDQTDVDNLYGSGTPPCLEDLATVTKNKMTNHWKLGTFNGSTEADAMLDQIGSDDLTNVGSTPFTGTGLSVECGGTPTPPSNALPSNLPTIL